MSQPPESKGPSLGDQVFEALVRLFWGASQHSQSLKREHGVTAAQVSALRVVERHGPLSHSALAEQLFLRPSTVSGMFDRLEKSTLIERSRSRTDRRQVEVSLAERGRDLLASLPKGQSKFGELRRLVAELPESEARIFLRTCQRILGVMTQDPSLEAAGELTA